MPIALGVLKRALRQRGLHSSDSLIPHARQDVAVAVQRHSHRRVAQHLLHQLRVVATAQEQCGAGVPEVMKTYVGQPRLLEEIGRISLSDNGAYKDVLVDGNPVPAILNNPSLPGAGR
jgi:hypothetical protein